MPDIELKCKCGNPECKQEFVLRRGAVFTADSPNKPAHYNQGYINIYGATPFNSEGKPINASVLPEVMLDPEQMRELRDWLNEQYKD